MAKGGKGGKGGKGKGKGGKGKGKGKGKSIVTKMPKDGEMPMMPMGKMSG